MDEIRILSPTAILGYGFPESSFRAGLAREPHLIAVDAGSTDPLAPGRRPECALPRRDRRRRRGRANRRADRVACLMTMKLTDVASVIRSKNAGPYELTLWNAGPYELTL